MTIYYLTIYYLLFDDFAFIDEATENVVIGINATVAQERPPAAHLFRALHIDIDDGFHFLTGWGFVEQLSLWTGYKGGSPERDTILLTHTIDCDDGKSVGYGMSTLNGLPSHALALLFLGRVVGIVTNGSRVDQHLGTLKRHQTGSLWIPLVPTNEYT